MLSIFKGSWKCRVRDGSDHAFLLKPPGSIFGVLRDFGVQDFSRRGCRFEALVLCSGHSGDRGFGFLMFLEISGLSVTMYKLWKELRTICGLRAWVTPK